MAGGSGFKKTGETGQRLSEIRKECQDRRMQANQLMKDFQERLRLAWLKALLLMDLWEPQLLQKGLEFLDEVIKFLDEVERLLTQGQWLLEVLRILSETPELRHLADELISDLSQLGGELDCEEVWKRREKICRLAALTFCLGEALGQAPLVEQFRELSKGLSRGGIRLTVERVQARSGGPVFWEFMKGPGELELHCLWATVSRAVSPGNVANQFQGCFRVVTGPEEQLEIIRTVTKALEKFKEINAALSEEGQQILIRALSRKDPGSKADAFHYLNKLWQETLRWKASLRETAEPPPLVKLEEDLQIIGAVSSAPQSQLSYAVVGKQRRASSGVHAGNPPQENGRVLNIAVSAWWRFCVEILGLEILPQLGAEDQAGHLIWDFQPELEDIVGKKPSSVLVKDKREKLFYEVKQLGLSPSRRAAVSFDAFWCREFPEERQWTVVVNLPPDLWQLINLENPKKLENVVKLAEILRRWQIKLLQYAFRSDSSSKVKVLSKAEMDRLRDDGFAQELHNLVCAAWGVDAQGKVSRPENPLAKRWLEAVESFLGVRVYPRKREGDAGSAGFELPEGYSLENIECVFDAALPRTVVACKQFAVDPQRCRLVVSAGPLELATEIVRSAYQLHKAARELRKSCPNLPQAASLAELVESLIKHETFNYLEFKKFHDSDRSEVLEKIIDYLNQLHHREPQAVQLQFLRSLEAWAQSFGYGILPSGYTPNFKWEKLAPEERKWAKFEFRDDVPCGTVIVEEFGYIQKGKQQPIRPPSLTVSAGGMPTEWKILRKMVEDWDGGRELRDRLSTHLAKWPEEMVRGGSKESCTIGWYETLCELPPATGASEQEEFWRCIRERFKSEVLSGIKLFLWEPNSFSEALDERRCISINQCPPGANHFEVVFPGLQQSDGTLVVAARVRLIRR
ncbi:MAG: hypothetical protein NZ899_06360 [Thermoguttaceae bacterium]|nr:hypothetical protein [Thermoguttaceae bacterium]